MLGIVGFIAISSLIAGCSGSPATDSGTTKGTYVVVVIATSGSGSSQIQASVNVPITIQ
jgi:major membrane immunogen (membrane-anchored lipoprotein)